LASPELGAKQICPNCQAKFYDLGRRPAHCPKCENEFDPDEAVRTRRVRTRVLAPEPDEGLGEQVVAEDAEDAEVEDEDEEEEISAPEIDEPVDDPVIAGDDEDDAEPGVSPVADDELAAFSEEEEDLEDDADVPFLEDEDDDEFDDSEIDGLPTEDDER
jgi:uncharacterized protein (TIGR02300 family)